jgi:CrcB protein
MRAALYVGVGGFAGSVLRYLLSLIPVSEKAAFPVVTLAINVIGSFAIGILSALAARHEGISPEVMLLLRVGVCGGFTTFSTFALEITTLAGAGRGWMAALYVLASLAMGGLAVLAGKAVAG